MGTEKIILQDVRHGRPRSGLRLLAPLRYLQIHHPEKARYDFLVPLTLGTSLWLGYLLLAPAIPIFGDAGVLRYSRDLLIMAVPFLVGALASVAMGMPGVHLDRRPPGAEIILDGRVLTLRQFVCYLLGYLSFIAFVTLLVSVAAPLLHDTISKGLGGIPWAKRAIFTAGTLALFELFAVLVVTVLWALYFLTDIVNRPAKLEDADTQ